ncbi:hypothetical protein B0T25DRAFT_569905 [Lasiosphaeria hispida]|uniref:Aminoglycoside phosphotransferase domain-containing protein n=1 Tax=Lasiosphaeria hispida TaxID=260671 RepID=A0AAJ0HE93_9PEZI|nr:hypothetical protein B0T25DRAFT_569905 [Lasiosphaeria hispida]
MSWVAKNTTIPIPDVVAYDASTNNPIAHEYTLLFRADGATLSGIYDSLDEEQLGQILDQLANFLTQLHARTQLGRDRQRETVESLNIRGPYSPYVDFVSGQVRQCLRLIHLHAKFAFMRDVAPRLEVFLAVLPQFADEPNRWPLWLAHKDLHFAHMLYDAASGNTTAMQDVADFLRAIVEVVPRDQRKELVPKWKETVLENVARFGL